MNEKSCDKFEEQIIDWIDGSLDSEAVRVVSEHVESCPGCAEHYRQTQELFTMLNEEEPAAEPRPGTFQRLSGELDSAMRSNRRFPGWLIAVAAAILLLASSALVVRCATTPRSADAPQLLPPENLSLTHIDAALGTQMKELRAIDPLKAPVNPDWKTRGNNLERVVVGEIETLAGNESDDDLATDESVDPDELVPDELSDRELTRLEQALERELKSKKPKKG